MLPLNPPPHPARSPPTRHTPPPPAPPSPLITAHPTTRLRATHHPLRHSTYLPTTTAQSAHAPFPTCPLPARPSPPHQAGLIVLHVEANCNSNWHEQVRYMQRYVHRSDSYRRTSLVKYPTQADRVTKLLDVLNASQCFLKWRTASTFLGTGLQLPEEIE